MNKKEREVIKKLKAEGIGEQLQHSAEQIRRSLAGNHVLVMANMSHAGGRLDMAGYSAGDDGKPDAEVLGDVVMSLLKTTNNMLACTPGINLKLVDDEGNELPMPGSDFTHQMKV